MDNNQTTPPAPYNAFLGPIKALWKKYGLLFIVAGIGLIFLKFSGLIMSILGWSSKQDLKKAEKTDTQLQKAESAAGQESDKLVNEANQLPKTEGDVPDDWYKNQK